MSNVEIICENLSKSFSGKQVFKDLSFKISNTQSLSVTGKNGSGKSTLIKILSNLILPSNGKILLQQNGMPLEKEKWFHKIGLLSPYINLYDELTGFENLNFFYKLKSSDEKNIPEKINFLLQKTGLYDNRNELVRNYSSGMKQKLKIAFAIMKEPEILIMDEPRTNLDSTGLELIYEVSNKQKEKGILIIATNEESDNNICDISINIEDYK
ncbi:MAG: ABC transporter ATP-binding protein [Ignavibacteriaceae bacterium]